MENIRFGKLGASDEEVYAAARAANAHEFITSFPEGYHTVVGECWAHSARPGLRTAAQASSGKTRPEGWPRRTETVLWRRVQAQAGCRGRNTAGTVKCCMMTSRTVTDCTQDGDGHTQDGEGPHAGR